MSADNLSVPDASKTYTSFVSDIDLAAEARPSPDTAKRGPAREIRCNAGSGTLAVTYADKTQDAIPGLNAGDFIRGKFVAIRSSGTSGVTSVTVFW